MGKFKEKKIGLKSLIMTCFSCAAMGFRYSKRARTFFTKYVPSRSFGGHVT